MIRLFSTVLFVALPALGSAQTPIRLPVVETPKVEPQEPQEPQVPKPQVPQVPQPQEKPVIQQAKPVPGVPQAGAPVDPKPVVETETDIVGIGRPEQVPSGNDPADIAAMKSAQDMLRAEQRLKQLLKEGKIKDVDRILTFEEIASWPYEDGLTGMPKAVKQLDGEKVMMTGFMLPIDEVEGIKEFLLVQSLWSCCYGQPPDINGIVRVVMKGKARIDYQFDPIKIIGNFKVEAAFEDGYCLDIYQLHADSVEAIR